ncbi:acyltransferase [Erythrobacter sp. NFXS35]|uniref:acyltransferase family protein n=1 Tax=Erythrobacter sp. NFXS35 TaxID=2818436 RepID=UPI0032DE440D
MVAATLPGQAGTSARAPYRPEIDGLRALAIAPVVVHHAAPGLLPGGFTGVDVFFVISGYLITAIIAGELANGHFSLWRFWERRLRRIVPALAAMLAGCTLAAWAILIPEDFSEYAKALVAASVFASNLHFARGTDYFASLEGAQPLIHTWTLGVEEQFYLVFPLLILAASRLRPGGMLALAALLGAASFAMALWFAPRWPLAAFYLLPTRMWELMLGAACALLPRQPRANGALAAAGIGLILAGYWLIGPSSAAPGGLFLLPTIGAALVLLFAQGRTAVGQVLGWRVPVWIGLISFGTYLWHQPILFFLQYVHFGPLPLPHVLAGIAASVALGALSYRLIERPVRQGRWLARPAMLVAVCAGTLGLPLATGAAAHFGLLGPHGLAEAERLGGVRPPNASVQVIQPSQEPLHFVLYGDSHAAQYYDAAAARFGPGALLSGSGCFAAGGYSNQEPGHPAGDICQAQPDRLSRLVRQREIRTVIWAQRWERRLYAPQTATPLGMTFGAGASYLRQAMERHADSLPAGTRVIIIGNSPTAWAAGDLLESGWLRCRAWRNVACPNSYPEARAEGRTVNAVLRAFAAADPRFSYVDAQAPLCERGRCLLLQEGMLNYWDGSHMTAAAAARVMATIDPALIAP